MVDESVILARGIALHAAASSWSGISAVKDRNKSILETAKVMEDWLLRPETEWEREALDG